MLVLDEPTNDLDVDTLELLEELLTDYDGTLLLVSHDRTFLDNVVTSTIVFEGEGRVAEYVGGYDDWLRQRRPAPVPAAAPGPKPARRENGSGTAAAAGKPVKLSYKEKRELEGLPARIESLEHEEAELAGRVGEAGFYRQERDVIADTLARLDRIRDELQHAYRRWEQLESRPA